MRTLQRLAAVALFVGPLSFLVWHSLADAQPARPKSAQAVARPASVGDATQPNSAPPATPGAPSPAPSVPAVAPSAKSLFRTSGQTRGKQLVVGSAESIR